MVHYINNCAFICRSSADIDHRVFDLCLCDRGSLMQLLPLLIYSPGSRLSAEIWGLSCPVYHWRSSCMMTAPPPSSNQYLLSLISGCHYSAPAPTPNRLRLCRGKNMNIYILFLTRLEWDQWKGHAEGWRQAVNILSRVKGAPVAFSGWPLTPHVCLFSVS